MNSTRGKLRMVKAMTGKAMPRIRLLGEKKASMGKWQKHGST